MVFINFGLKKMILIKHEVFFTMKFFNVFVFSFSIEFKISAADDTNEDSVSNQNHHNKDGEISLSDSGPSTQSGIYLHTVF